MDLSGKGFHLRFRDGVPNDTRNGVPDEARNGVPDEARDESDSFSA
jgi:hypothetical protein